MKKLSADEIQTMLERLPEWKLDGDMLVRDWVFPTFTEAMVFVNQVATIAEQLNHHPDIDIRYNRVRLALISHDSGGLTRRDEALACSIDEETSRNIHKTI